MSNIKWYEVKFVVGVDSKKGISEVNTSVSKLFTEKHYIDYVSIKNVMKEEDYEV